MPDESKETPKENPLSGMITKVAGKEDTERSSFPVAFVIAAIAALGFAVMGFLLMRARRKAAILASKLRKAEEAKVQAVENRKLAKNKEDRKKASETALLLGKEINKLEDELKALDESSTERRESLAELTKWDDFVVVDRRDQ
jgi:uncharacterized protein HemX